MCQRQGVEPFPECGAGPMDSRGVHQDDLEIGAVDDAPDVILPEDLGVDVHASLLCSAGGPQMLKLRTS